MKQFALSVFVFLLFLGNGAALQSQQTCQARGLDFETTLKSANIVYLRMMDDSFPEQFANPFNPSDVIQNVRSLFVGAMSDGAIDWNQGCGPAPILNDQPIIIPVGPTFTLPAGPSGSQGANIVDLIFVNGFSSDSEPCAYFPGEVCHTQVTRTFLTATSARIEIYSKWGREGAPYYTLLDYRTVYHRLIGHELGHALLLDHDECLQSILNFEILTRSECALNDPDCEPRVRQEHCNEMERIFEPADPLERILTEDPNSLCRFQLYCDFDTSGPLTPWAKIRSGCVWFEDVVQTFVDTYDQTGQHLTGAVRTFSNFRCFSSSFSLTPPIVASAPFLMVALPQPGTVLQDGLMRVAGWVWGRSHSLRELRVFVDQQDAQLVSFSLGIDSHAICSAGFDPGYCDNFGGFAGWVDVHGFAAGLHKLQIVATDTAGDPLPSNLELEFVIPDTFGNHIPSPQNDEIIITLIEGTSPPVTMDLLANDFDIDGQPIQLSSNAFVEYPTQGSVVRVNSREVAYSPFPWATGEDTFRYQIIDTQGAQATAVVHIQLMEAIVLP